MTTENKREKIINEAAYQLSDEIWPIRDKLEKAHLVLCEVQDEYFLKYSRDNKEEEIFIWHGFSKNSILTSIVEDYLWEAFKAIEELEKRGHSVMDVKSKIEEVVGIA